MAASSDDTEVLLESNFRRLLACIEAEREKLRIDRRRMGDEKDKARQLCEAMKEETEKWCINERQKISKAWQEVKEIHDRLDASLPDGDELLTINCAGNFFEVKKSTLSVIKGSKLACMFSRDFIRKVLPTYLSCF